MIGTYNEDGSVDVMMMAWGGICDMKMVALNLEADHKTVEKLRKRNAFTLAVPGVETIRESDFLGICIPLCPVLQMKMSSYANAFFGKKNIIALSEMKQRNKKVEDDADETWLWIIWSCAGIGSRFLGNDEKTGRQPFYGGRVTVFLSGRSGNAAGQPGSLVFKDDYVG